MTDETLIETLQNIDITEAKTLIPQKAVYVTRPTDDGYFDEFVVLLDNNVRVGGIYIMGDTDIHAVVFEEFRSRHFLSNFMRSGHLMRIRPGLKSTSTGYDPNLDDEYKVVQHLASLAGLQLKP